MIQVLKDQVGDNELFKKLVADTVKRRQVDLPKVDDEIRQTKKAMIELEDKERELQNKLLSSDFNDSLVQWLSEQVEQLGRNRKAKIDELDFLQKRRDEILDESGLMDIQAQVKKALHGFDRLTRTQQRLLLDNVVDRIVVRSDNHLDIHLVGSGAVTALTGRKQKLD